MTRRQQRRWYERRTAKDAPSWMADPAWDSYSAWAEGYNDAVKACINEMDEFARKEGLRDE